MLQDRTGQSPDTLRGDRRINEIQKLLTDERRKITDAALAHGHRVFIIAQAASADAVRRQAEALGYPVKVLTSWSPIIVPLPRHERRMGGRPQRQRDWSGRGGERAPLFHLLELTKAPPKIIPTTQAATRTDDIETSSPSPTTSSALSPLDRTKKRQRPQP